MKKEYTYEEFESIFCKQKYLYPKFTFYTDPSTNEVTAFRIVAIEDMITQCSVTDETLANNSSGGFVMYWFIRNDRFVYLRGGYTDVIDLIEYFMDTSGKIKSSDAIIPSLRERRIKTLFQEIGLSYPLEEGLSTWLLMDKESVCLLPKYLRWILRSMEN